MRTKNLVVDAIWIVFEIWKSNRCGGKKERRTRRLQLQATVKDSYLTFTLTLKVNIHSLVCSFKDKSLRTDMVNQTTESTGKSSNFHGFWS